MTCVVYHIANDKYTQVKKIGSLELVSSMTLSTEVLHGRGVVLESLS